MNYRVPTPHVPVFAPRVYHCRRATKPFTLDGNLDKEFWAEAPWTEDFEDIEGDIRPKPRFRTRAKILWDDENIYFGAELMGDEIWSHVTKRDDVIFRDNDFEIFIDPDSDTQCYCEFEMNARNTVWDLLLTKAYRDQGKPMNGFDLKGLRTAVKIDGELNNPNADNTRWCCEIVMPFETLIECLGQQEKKAPAAGDFWRINFSRVQWTVDVENGEYVKRQNPETGAPLPEDNWVWSPTGIVNMHYPELWGFVFFCSGDEQYAIPEDEKLKWELRRYYYAQHANYDRCGSFSEGLTLPDSPIAPKIQTTDHWFEMSCPTADGKGKLVIFADGKTARYENQ